jgi:uncharacterized membrane protein YkvA (DUF1232 family)
MSGDMALVEPDPQQTPKERLAGYAMLLPRLGKLVVRLMKDPRVPARSKAALLVLGAYLVSPVDLIPDFIPGIGHVDDLILVVFALDQILNRVPEEVVQEHWEGDENVLEVIRNVLDIASAFVPGWLKRRFGAS